MGGDLEWADEVTVKAEPWKSPGSLTAARASSPPER